MLKRPLKDYQVADGRHIATRTGALVAHEPRVGKTNVGIYAADLRRAKIVVVVCPASVISNWRKAIEEFRQGEWTALIVSYNMVGKLLAKIRGIPIDVVIIDESHLAKSRDAARTRFIYGTLCDRIGGLIEHASAVYCLTGTPLPNSPLELWPMLRAIAPELIMQPNGKPLSMSAFRDRYCKIVRTPFGFKIAGSKNYKDLKSKLAGFMIRRTRKEVFGRDVQAPTKVFISPSAESRAELRDWEQSVEGKRIRTAIESGGMEALHKLEGQAATMRRMFGLAKVPGLSSLIADELDADPKMKIIVGCYHTAVVDAYANSLRRFGVVTFDGRIDKARKVRINEKFQTDLKVRVAVGQISAMGLGLDFSAANDCIFAESSWVGDENAQFWSRIFNLAKDDPCFVRFAVLPGSIDETIATACERKLNDSRRILDA